MDGGAPKRRSNDSPELSRISFAALDGWPDDDHAAALSAFRAGAAVMAQTTPKDRALAISGAALARIAQAAVTLGRVDGDEARRFFERHFVPHRVRAAGFVTGYYEPEVAASRVRSERFSVPLYRRPPDLVELRLDEQPPGWSPDLRFARRTPHGIEPFPDRAAIEAGALAGQGLELAWVESEVDAFFIHVQGSARLKLADGNAMRIGFDGKSGHAYTSIGRLAVTRGVLPLAGADKDGLEGWLKQHPDEGRALMRENRSFIFFRETSVGDNEGPVGAAGIPLHAGRSLAVDRTLHTFHAPIWVVSEELADPPRPSFRRLMVAHDTGSAIVGPARGDIFYGSGTAAGSVAGRVRHDATMVAFVPTDGGGRL